MGKRSEGNTRLQYVLRLLVEYKRFNKKFNLAQGPDGVAYGWEPVGGGWLPAYAFRGPFLGGDQGDKRCRELRYMFGIPIEKKIHHWEHEGEKKFTYLYRITCPVDEIDVENICHRPKPVVSNQPSAVRQISMLI